MSQNIQIENPQVTFFFERGGEVIPVQEKEAWRIMQNRGRIYANFKYIGATNGVKYRDAVVQAVSLQKAGNIIGAQELLRKAFKDEAELAKGNMVQPRNMDKMGPDAHLI